MSKSSSQTSAASSTRMSPTERHTTFSLACIFAFRMLGLFMILPVFVIYAPDYGHASASLIGFTLGIYGLTQALFQLPLGFLSDRHGRKPIIIIGLIIFAIGSIVAALSTSIYGLILGRALQGAGAIGSTTIALLADLTREQQRTKAMAMLGMSIGVAFALAMVLGPIIASFSNLAGIFWITTLFALIAIIIVLKLVPTPLQTRRHRDTETIPALIASLLKNKELLRLDLGIFCLHAVLTASFIDIPIAFHDIGYSPKQQWPIYLPVLAAAFLTMLPAIALAERKQMMKPIFLSAICILVFAQISLAFWHASIVGIALGLFIFFTAFSLLEACLPSLISKLAPAASKGTAMGIYSSAQFLGIFVGGTVGGIFQQELGLSGLFISCAIFAVLWLITAINMNKPEHLHTHVLKIKLMDDDAVQALTKKLMSIPGVADVTIILEQKEAYLKVNNRQFHENDLLILNETASSPTS